MPTIPRVTLADTLAAQIRLVVGIPEPEREYEFAKTIGRKWAADLAWPPSRLLAECEGGIWQGGRGGGVGISRHTHGKGYMNDIEKYNTAVLLGWRVLRFTIDHIRSGEALTIIEQALRA